MEKKQVSLQSFNIPKCIVAGSSMVEGQPATSLKRDSNKAVFLRFANFLRIPILKNISERLLLEGLFSLLFYCENGINQYAVQKILTDVFGASLLLLELGCLRYVLLLYHLRMLRVFMRISKSFV